MAFARAGFSLIKPQRRKEREDLFNRFFFANLAALRLFNVLFSAPPRETFHLFIARDGQGKYLLLLGPRSLFIPGNRLF